MKKKWLSFFSLLLSICLLFAGAALAAPGSGKGGGKNNAPGSSGSTSVSSDSGAPSLEEDHDEDESGDGEKAYDAEEEGNGGEEEGNEDGVDEEATDDENENEEDSDADSDDRSANERARKGLENALQRVKGTPAEKVIADLLDLEDTEEGTTEEDDGSSADPEALFEKLLQLAESEDDETEKKEKEIAQQGKEALKAYADTLREQIKAQKGELKQKIKLLQKLSELYEEAGALEEAIATQKEAIKADVRNLEAYKKLAQLYAKAGQAGVKAFVNGEPATFDVPPVIQGGRTLVPFRAISESLQADVRWNPEERAVVVTKDGTEVKLVLGKNVAYVNGQKLVLDTPAKSIKGRTVVPFRLIAEAFGADVQWDPETKSIIILDEEQTATEPSSETTSETSAQ